MVDQTASAVPAAAAAKPESAQRPEARKKKKRWKRRRIGTESFLKTVHLLTVVSSSSRFFLTYFIFAFNVK